MTTLLRTALALLLLASACTAPRERPAPRPASSPAPEASGFLDDYKLLREGRPGEMDLVYHNPQARWTQYDKVLIEHVTLWRSGRGSLDPVPEADLLRLIVDFEQSLRRRLGKDFTVVTAPGPGVLRVRLGITQARATDPILDVIKTHGRRAVTKGTGPVHPEMRKFLESAAIEGELQDAESGEILAQGVQRRRREGGAPLDTWAEVDRALDAWVDRICGRLEARTGRR